MHIAVLSGQTEAVKKLIKLGADVNSTNNKGSTALHLATFLRNKEEIIKILLENGAEPNPKDIKKYPQYFSKELITALSQKKRRIGVNEAIDSFADVKEVHASLPVVKPRSLSR